MSVATISNQFRVVSRLNQQRPNNKMPSPSEKHGRRVLYKYKIAQFFAVGLVEAARIFGRAGVRSIQDSNGVTNQFGGLLGKHESQNFKNLNPTTFPRL